MTLLLLAILIFAILTLVGVEMTLVLIATTIGIIAIFTIGAL